MRWPVARRWHAALTFADLGELTAQWLEGTLSSQPSCQPNSGPDPETLPHVATLAAVNRAGFVTTGSQPGYLGLGYDDREWWQRAAVTGFADTAFADRLEKAAIREGLVVRCHHNDHDRPRWWQRTPPGDLGLPVTGNARGECTWFGRRYYRRDVEQHYAECCDDMLEALCSGWQVTIIDPVIDRNDLLWPLLDKIASEAPA